jgi:ribose/xylose/arabinose/galactoside ABC-type transport system permease subunit
MSGLLSAVGGLVLGAFTGTSYVKGARGYEMISVAVVVIAGFSMTGGTGNVLNVMLSTFFVRVLNKIMIFMNLSDMSEGIYVGIILLAVLYFSTRERHNRIPKQKQFELAGKRGKES